MELPFPSVAKVGILDLLPSRIDPTVCTRNLCPIDEYCINIPPSCPLIVRSIKDLKLRRWGGDRQAEF